MIRNTSTNNLEKIKYATKSNNPKYIFLVDYANNIKSFLDFCVDQSLTDEKSSFICFTERRPEIDHLEKDMVLEKNWSLQDYKNFFLGKPGEKLEKHESVYSGDVARLPMWRKLYAMGRLSFLSKKLRSLVPPRIVEVVIDPILVISGLIIQIVIPSTRVKMGKVEFSYKGHPVTIYYDGSPEKDHYGESPVVAKKIELFEKIAMKHSKGFRSGFFIGAGPRHLYMERIFNLEDNGEIKDYFIFSRGLFRPKAFQITNRRQTGSFHPGNNLSTKGKPVYSDHCLSIGAGEKEIWYYSTSPDSNHHEKI